MIADFNRVLRIVPSCTAAHGVALPDETFEVTSRVSVTLKQLHVAMFLQDIIIRYFPNLLNKIRMALNLIKNKCYFKTVAFC
jgi:hypothetical protein